MNSSKIKSSLWGQFQQQREEDWAHPSPGVQISGYTYHMSTTHIQLSNLLIMNILKTKINYLSRALARRPTATHRADDIEAILTRWKLKFLVSDCPGTWKLNPRAVVHHSSDCAIILKNCLHQSAASASNLRSLQRCWGCATWHRCGWVELHPGTMDRYRVR